MGIVLPVQSPGEALTREISVNSGEVAAGKAGVVLRASAIGSCVVVAAYHAKAAVGGMAHVMLPGTSPDPASESRTRYAEDAVEELMRKMAALGAEALREVCLVGGANVLGRDHDTPGPQIVESLTEIFGERRIACVAKHVGGMQRRSCSLDIRRARLTYTVADSEPRVLWEAAQEVRP